MRKLATIQKIANIRPIPGADRIVVADVLGWGVVVQKDEFQVGDLAVYFEIDSFIPHDMAPFLTEPGKEPREFNGVKGQRLKTKKLRKQLSQGLLMPLSKFPKLNIVLRDDSNIGLDVTEILKIEKWESPEEATSNAGGGIAKAAGSSQFPSFIQKTDQNRIQNYINELPKHAGETFEKTIKLDGSSMTLFHVPKDSKHYAQILADSVLRKVRKMKWWQKLIYKAKSRLGFGLESEPFFQGVCSRNVQLTLDGGSHFTEYAKANGMLEALENYGQAIAVQGELIGPNIQGNFERVDKLEFYVYDVFSIEDQAYFLPVDARRICAELGFNYVPVLDEAFTLRIGDAREIVDEILLDAEGPGMNKGVKREGVVYKSNATAFSFKAISNSYLLHKDGK